MALQEQQLAQQQWSPRFDNAQTRKLVKAYEKNPNILPVEELRQHASYHNVPFYEGDFSLFDAVRQLGGGFFEGFTTFSVADPPDNEYEAVARSLGHLIGFAPGILSGPLRWMGTATKATSLITAAKAIQGAKGAPLYIAEKYITPATRKVVGGALKTNLGARSNTVQTAKNFLLGEQAKSIMEGAFNLGTASAISSWQHGADAIMDSFFHGAVAGGVFRSIGNIIGKDVPKGKKFVIPVETEKAEKFVRGLAGSVFMGIPSTMRGATTPEQVYEYLMGAYFGGSEKPWTVHKAGKIFRDKVIPASEQDVVVRKTMDAERVPGTKWETLEPEVQTELRRMAKESTGGTPEQHTAAAYTLAERMGVIDKIKREDNVEKAVFENYEKQTSIEHQIVKQLEKISPEKKKKIKKDPLLEGLTEEEIANKLEYERKESEKREIEQKYDQSITVTWSKKRQGFVSYLGGKEIGFSKVRPLTKEEEGLYIDAKDRARSEATSIASKENKRIIAEGLAKEMKAPEDTQKKVDLKQKILQPISVQNRVKKITKMLKDKFEGKVDIGFVSDSTLVDDLGNPVQAYYDKKDKKVVINLALADSSAPFHEFAHPFLTEISLTNRPLYDKFIVDVLNTKEGRDLFHDVVDTYGANRKVGMSRAFDRMIKKHGDIHTVYKEKGVDFLFTWLQAHDKNDIIADELLAFSLEKSSEKQYPSQNRFRLAVNKIIDFFRQLFFGPKWNKLVYARALDVNLNLDDIARLMANSDRKIELSDKILNESYDFKPTNIIQFKVSIEKESQKIDGSKAVMTRNFFKDSWNRAKAIGATTEQFRTAMQLHLDADLTDAFKNWYIGKLTDPRFKGKPEQKGSTFRGIENEVIEDEIIEIQNELEEGTAWEDIKEGASTDLRTVGITNLVWLRALGIHLTKAQFNELHRSVTNKPLLNTYEKWRDFALPRYLGRTTKKITKKHNRELLRYYLMLKNSARTNTDIKLNKDGTLIGIDNAKNNWVIKKKTKFDENLQRFVVEKVSLELKGPINITSGNNNSNYEKLTLFETNNELDLFSFLSGSDTVSEQSLRYDEESGHNIKIWKPTYNFIENLGTLDLFTKELKKNNLAIAFSRGDSDKVALIEVKNTELDIGKSEKSTKDYWLAQRAHYKDRHNKELTRAMMNNFIKGDAWDRAANIAVHEAMSKVWPKYLFDKKGGANVYKRLKIPFTPVNVSREMPSLRVVKFNPDKVIFSAPYFKSDSDAEAMDVVGWTPVTWVEDSKHYVGDGNTLTSRNVFKLFEKHHGLKPNTAKAKTVIYENDGDNVLMIKHEHKMPAKNWEILDKKTGKVLFTIDDKNNILDAKGNAVDMLVTNDEAKVSELLDIRTPDNPQGEHTISGQSVGFIKYSDKVPVESKHLSQWYNHTNDPNVLRAFKDYYIAKLEKQIDEMYRLGVNTEAKKSHERIREFLQKMKGQDMEGFIPTAIELSNLGAGLHPAMKDTLDILIQTQKLNPALNLAHNPGSIYQVNLDVSNNLGEGEISLSRNSSKAVLKRLQELSGKGPNELNNIPMN